MSAIGRYVVLLTVGIAAAASLAAQSAPAPTQTAPVSAALSDAEIRKILADRIDVQRQSVGIVVGIVDASGRRIVTHGARAAGDTRPLDGDTIFEIGSMTKVFTALLLADAVERNEVALTDPVSKYLPETVTVPERGRAITLQDLANHTSGLPRMPSNFAPKDGANPYADYSVEQMYQFLSGHQLGRDVGAQVRVFEPRRRAARPRPGAARRHGLRGARQGAHHRAARHARHRHHADPVDAGAPRRRSHASARAGRELGPADVRRRGRAAIERERHAGVPVRRHRTHQLRRWPPPCRGRWPPAGRPVGSMEIALGWHIFKARGGDLIWHNGGTGGYRTFMGYNPRTRVGVVVLSNTSTAAGPDDIGRHLLDASVPLTQKFPPPPVARVEVKIDPALLDRYVGRYQLAPSAILTVTRDGGRGFVQLTGQPAFEIFAESEKKFFLKVVDAQLTFEIDAQNPAAAVVLHQNGLDRRAPRIEGSR